MAAKKLVGISITSLIGKQIKAVTKYSDTAEGPYKLVGVDANYLGLEREGKVFWWHNSYIYSISEYEAEVTVAE